MMNGRSVLGSNEYCITGIVSARERLLSGLMFGERRYILPDFLPENYLHLRINNANDKKTNKARKLVLSVSTQDREVDIGVNNEKAADSTVPTVNNKNPMNDSLLTGYNQKPLNDLLSSEYDRDSTDNLLTASIDMNMDSLPKQNSSTAITTNAQVHV